MSFEIDTQSFSFITFGKKEKQKPVPTVTEVKTSEVAATVFPNKNGSSGKSVPAYRETSLRLTKKRCVGD